MNFRELVEKRQSDRRYDPTIAVEPEMVSRIVETALLAPSACNAQPWHITIVDNPECCRQVSEAITSLGLNKFATDVPVHLIITEERPNFLSALGSVMYGKHFPHIDCGILAAHLVLAATAEGLGSCIIGSFNEKKLRKTLGIPRSRKILLDVVIGHSIDPHRPKVRKPEAETTSHNSYR